MPITVQVAEHNAETWHMGKAKTEEELLEQSCHEESSKSKGIIQTSFLRSFLQRNLVSSSRNGFVYAVYHAYSYHYHLVIRPEDIWFAILTQINFFINAHAEELRSFFVAHEGQKELEVVEQGTLASVNFGELALRMTHVMQKNILDPDLRDWVIPSFSTTTEHDRVVAAILMMGGLQKYFSYTMSLICGIPSVTLLGERTDWIEIERRLEKLTNLGAEPAQFAGLLRPVLRNFIQSFDDPESWSVKDFWSKIAHLTGGSGPYHLSGWITAFCFWDEDGKSLYGSGPVPPVSLRSFEDSRAGCELDGVFYHRVNTEDIPAGYASVPVKVNDNGEIYHTRMLAGSVGIQAFHGFGQAQVPTAAPGHEDIGPESDAYFKYIQPVSGWWMYEVEEPSSAESCQPSSPGIDMRPSGNAVAHPVSSHDMRWKDLKSELVDTVA